MRRRDFILAIGGAAVSPIAARAQQRTFPVIGYLYAGSPNWSVVAAFQKGLEETGYIEGRNVAIEYRWGQNESDRLPDLAADLVRRRVAVIATMGGTNAAFAAKAATTTTPIVFTISSDPVLTGLVASLNRPGGNVTGLTTISIELGPKRVGSCTNCSREARRFGLLLDPGVPVPGDPTIKELESAASAIGGQIEIFYASTNAEIDQAFMSLAHKGADALLIGLSPLFGNRRVQLAVLSARHALPAIYFAREFVEVGGLMSYGSSLDETNRQAGMYVGRILKGDKPGDLPVMQPTRFELVINLTTAKAIGLDIPPMLLALADEVIE